MCTLKVAALFGHCYYTSAELAVLLESRQDLRLLSQLYQHLLCSSSDVSTRKIHHGMQQLALDSRC